MTTTLITGANKGLGHETAKQLIAAGHEVWIGARDPARGRRAAEQLGGRFVQLDVTDDASVGAAAATVGTLDVLVDNAGISGGLAAPGDAGFTSTDFNGHRGVQTVEEGAEAIVRMALVAPDGPTGGFFDHNGTVAW